VPQIEVTFDIDANGIVHVSAKDLGTGKEQRITVTASTQLSKEEVERMVKEAQEKAAEDERRRELAEVRNQAESLVYATEKSLKDLGDKVSTEDRAQAESAMQAVREVLNGDDKSAIESALKQLEESAHKLATQAYQAQAGTPGADGGEPPSGEGGGTAEGDVIDADFRPSE
jgi:molecular chaperone DnaK